MKKRKKERKKEEKGKHWWPDTRRKEGRKGERQTNMQERRGDIQQYFQFLKLSIDLSAFDLRIMAGVRENSNR